jgi:DNA-binding transcriptional ArsR family regulator
MKVCGIIPVSELARSADLAGAADGAVWLQAGRRRVDAAQTGLHAIDFSGVRIATVSWLREGILALLKYASAVRQDLRFVATGLSEIVREELEVALEATGGVLIAADISPDRVLTAPIVLGRLDPALHDTLQAVEGQLEFDATFVSRAIPGVGLSAANNRLAALESKGILVSERRGRSRHYRPLLENLRYGYRNDRQGDGQLPAQAAEMPGPA